MSAVTLLLISAIAFIVAYFTYGKYLDRKLGVDPNRPTPAVEMADGKDYVSTNRPVLLGHHFATIAGGGPIVGPISAAVFGWIPAVLWIVLGSIFFGGVHDYASLQASIRHKAQSIGTVIKEYIGKRGQTLFLSFSIATIILIVGVFIVLVADTFANVPAAATASILFIFVAMLFGFFVNQMRVNFVLASIIGVIVMFACVWIGMVFPIKMSATFWVFFLIIYSYVASVLPVWLLLQPRDYLNSYLLYGMMLGGFIGILFANPTLQLAGFTGFYNENLGPLFPILFITIACGAISGFHSLVASGTTAKQLDNERSGRFIAYGGMLIEGFLAVIVVCSVAYLTTEQFTQRLAELGGPIPAFSAGLGYFMSHFGIPETVGTTFVALAASAFLMTTLDSATRLGRYGVQEFAEGRSKTFANPHVATGVIVVGAAALALSGTWSDLWPLFGSANQMLGALALLAVSVWLVKRGTKSWFAIIPMIFMFIVTLSALLVFMRTNFLSGNIFLVVCGFILFVLCIFLVLEAYRSFTKPKDKDTTVKA
ncbi:MULTISPECIES: carbon starvation protein A [Geobacillus]|jgi:carbon starvation protein|uniref:carbon starvation CstA family protein n=1 Tax=Geobacillus TaxID=129337 RepID=UPI000D3C1415|nr:MULTISPECIES: carbon starvation protein A [Geobacillus]MED0664375.1 carbon starvation protein A [Geobacillus thermodenitrificans]MED3719138.1 carbon starvation protein A [Geobacillus thermodenitrificans]MED3907295.1 carbon starvation protein A [Geobacillus thermodenitrificans]NNU88572.1 carbon starvation protein A [Geobacillus sp. MR]PTR45845.1 carbon starvation protein A [Geobacillus thermodenitrificans]